jgi:hypothetical protein
VSKSDIGDLGDLVGQFEMEIIAYLRRHPNAADDLSGVSYWWLYYQRYLRNLDLLERALGELAEAGWIACSNGVTGRVIYRAGPRLGKNPTNRTVDS